MNAILTIGHFAITPYSLAVFFALCAFFLTGVFVARGFKSVGAQDILRDCLILFPAGLIGSRLLYCAAHYDLYFLGDGNFFAFFAGGHSLAGALLASCAALLLLTRSARRFLSHCDALTPGAMLMVAILRFGERFSGQGFGKEIDTGFLRGGFFAMYDVYGDARHAVYRYEMVAALLLFAFSLFFVRRHKKGETARVTFLLFCAMQTLFESLREDDCLALEFVRVAQVVYFLTLLALCAFFAVRAFRSGMRGAGFLVPLAVMALGGTMTVVQEFRVDTDFNLELNYLFMFLSLAALSCAALWLRREGARLRR